MNASKTTRGRVQTWLRQRPRLGAALVGLTNRIVVHWHAGPPTGLKAGRLVAPDLADQLPVSLLVLHETDNERVIRTVRMVSELQVLVGGFRPVFLIDRPFFAEIRRAGYAAEHLVPRTDWEERLPVLTWADYVTGRIAECCSTYDPDVTIMISAGAEVDRDLLGALLGSAARRRPAAVPTAVRRRYRRFVRWLDQPS